MIENLVDQYISDTYGYVVQYESGSFYDGFGNFIQNVGSGSSNTDTGSFVTTSSFNSFTSSINGYTSSLNNATSSFILNSQTSSMSVLSASFATSASYALNATTASFALNANINTGSFATTGSNTFNGNQTITGSATISGSSVNGALSIDCNTPATSYGSLTIKSTTNAGNNAVLSLVSTAAGPNWYVTGSSIDFWSYQAFDFPTPNAIAKTSFIQDLNDGLNFGSQGSFKWNSFFVDGGYTGSTAAVDGSGNLTGNPIGTNLLTLNSNNLSSSVTIVAPSLTLAAGGNLTIGTNGVLIAPAVFNTKTATYTLQSSDIGKIIEMNSGSANNLIIPLNLSTTIGFSVDVIQLGPGQTSVSASAGVTIRSAGGRTKLTTQYSAASLTQRALNEYYLVGDLTA